MYEFVIDYTNSLYMYGDGMLIVVSRQLEHRGDGMLIVHHTI
jgi:hypothetical protein